MHEWFLGRHLMLNLFWGQEVVQLGEDRMRPLRPDELHTTLEVAPWCQVDGGELAKFSAGVALIVAKLGEI